MLKLVFILALKSEEVEEELEEQLNQIKDSMQMITIEVKKSKDLECIELGDRLEAKKSDSSNSN